MSIDANGASSDKIGALGKVMAFKTSKIGDLAETKAI